MASARYLTCFRGVRFWICGNQARRHFGVRWGGHRFGSNLQDAALECGVRAPLWIGVQSTAAIHVQSKAVPPHRTPKRHQGGQWPSSFGHLGVQRKMFNRRQLRWPCLQGCQDGHLIFGEARAKHLGPVDPVDLVALINSRNIECACGLWNRGTPREKQVQQGQSVLFLRASIL
jgi:hypothetical protein